MADTKAPPAPPEPSVYAPAPAPPAVTIGWATPPSQAKAPAENRKAKGRGIPAAPAFAAAGNATVLAVTSAYDAAGWPGLAGAAGAVVAGTAGAVVRRRRTVKARNATVRAGRAGSPRTGSGAGRGAGSGAGGSAAGSRTGSGSAGGSRAGSAAPRTSSGTSAGSGSRSGAPKAANRSTGSRGTSALNRIADRLLGGDGKAPKTKAAKHSKKPPKGASRSEPGAMARARQKAAKAWAADKPRRTRNRAAARAALRHARRAGAHALRSVRSGIWGTIRHLSLRKGAARAWATWKARTHRTSPNPVPAQPTVASTVRRPTATTPTTSGPGAAPMSGHHFVAPAMEAARAAAAYSPTGMMQVGRDFAGLQQALELYAETMKVTVENADARYPLAPQIIDMMRQIHTLQLKAAEMAKELQPAFRNLHQVDIARIEQPRKGITGEAMWDVTRNTA